MTTTEKGLVITGVLALCGLILFEIWYKGTSHKINDSPAYGKLIGNTYYTNMDVFISQSRQSGKYFIKVPGWYCPEVKEIKEYPYGGVSFIIHKLVPKGTRITITNVILTNKPFRGSDIWLMGKFDDKQIFPDEVCVNSISDYKSMHEKMNPKYVTEITSEGEPTREK